MAPATGTTATSRLTSFHTRCLAPFLKLWRDKRPICTQQRLTPPVPRPSGSFQPSCAVVSAYEHVMYTVETRVEFVRSVAMEVLRVQISATTHTHHSKHVRDHTHHHVWQSITRTRSSPHVHAFMANFAACCSVWGLTWPLGALATIEQQQVGAYSTNADATGEIKHDILSLKSNIY